jgi:hypothetical protein
MVQMFSSKNWMTHQQRCTIIVLLFVAIAGLNACKPKEVELPFETIERQSTAGTGIVYETQEPGLIVIIDSKGIDQLDGLVTSDAVRQLEEIDYKTHFAVIAFLGWQPTGHEGIRIERLARTDNSVSIFAQVGRQKGDDVVTSPYHLVKVTKTGHWDAVITFNLIASGTTLATKSQRVP